MQNSKLKIQQEFYNNFLKSMPKDQIIRVRGAPQIENWTTSIYKIECLLLKQQSSSIDFNNVFVYNSLKLDCGTIIYADPSRNFEEKFSCCFMQNTANLNDFPWICVRKIFTIFNNNTQLTEIWILGQHLTPPSDYSVINKSTCTPQVQNFENEARKNTMKLFLATEIQQPIHVIPDPVNGKCAYINWWVTFGTFQFIVFVPLEHKLKLQKKYVKINTI